MTSAHSHPHSAQLAHALAHKARNGALGGIAAVPLAKGPGWSVTDVVCTCGPRDLPFEERHDTYSTSLVLSGTFVCRSAYGSSLLGPGSLFLMPWGLNFECSHQHGEGDRCLSFQFEPALFEHIAHDVGARRPTFNRHDLPPVRELSPMVSRAARAGAEGDSFEEIALELAAIAIRLASTEQRRKRNSTARHEAQITRVLRYLAAHSAEHHSITELAGRAGLSPYHFLRTFKRVVGVTPHQWLVRTRIRQAAQRLTSSRAPVTAIALDVGFEDLSNFMHSFRAEFGTTPRRYRLAS